VPVEPKVKSAKTRELFNAGVISNVGNGKSADPTCYHSLTVDLTGLFDSQTRRMTMAIYTRNGALVQIEEAELRQRWWAMIKTRNECRSVIFDTEPTAKQLKNATETETFKIWWVKARQLSAYPDGSGKDGIGKMIDYGNGGWLDENEFRADDGIREIHRSCEAAASATAMMA
jgi:hypothetical protein